MADVTQKTLFELRKKYIQTKREIAEGKEKNTQLLRRLRKEIAQLMTKLNMNSK